MNNLENWLEPIIIVIKGGRLGWYGHVMRMVVRKNVCRLELKAESQLEDKEGHS